MSNGWKYLAIAASLVGSAQAAPIGVDGTIGAEWGGPSASVGFDAGASTSNFGSPSNVNHNVAYSIYLRADANYLYGAVKAAGATGGLDFANLYFNVDGQSGPFSDLGVEVTNDRFFIPGGAGYTNDTSNLLTFATGTGVIEFAIDWSMLRDDPYGMVFNTASSGGNLIMSLSQSFGYSVAGGAGYGANRLGAVTVPGAAVVPEPGALLLTSAALLALVVSRRRH